jgi:hypothetical protein
MPMQAVLLAPTPVRRLAAGWLLLALGALALSTLCAVLLIVARLPWSGAPSGLGDLFGRALVLHVSQAVVVWFLACAAALWTLASGATASPARWAALLLAVCGLVAMVVPLFLPGVQPVLANYVPVLNHPVFFAGLALFAAGLALHGALALPALLRRVRQGALWQLGALLSIGVLALALLALLAGGVQLLGQAQPEQAAALRFELLAWGPGHILQFVHMLLLMSVWMLLGQQVLGPQALAPRRWLQGLLLLAAAPVLCVPLIYFHYAVDSADFRRAFTWLMAWGIWPAAALLALRLLQQTRRAGRSAWQSPQAPALLLSILLFLLGCVLGALIRSDTTVVPAHYHGTVGAVTLAYMGLGYHLLGVFGGQPVALARQRWQTVLYGSGLLLLALGLAWSGWLGAPRKTSYGQSLMAYGQSLLANPGYFVATGLAGLGGMLAIGGAGLFVFNIARATWRDHGPTRALARPGDAGALARPGDGRAPPRRGDVRLRALALTLLLVGLFGVLLAYVGTDSQGSPTAPQASAGSTAPAGAGAVSLAGADAARAHAAQMLRAEVESRFGSGVTLLKSRSFEPAAAEFERVLELAPAMPEAHANLGFALLGSQRYAQARDSFQAALAVNAGQLNAHYGLALALQGLQDLQGARAAMRSYVQLSRADDPYVAKAQATLRQWDLALQQAQTASRASPGEGAR